MESSDTMKDHLPDELEMMCLKGITLGKVKKIQTQTKGKRAITAGKPSHSEPTFKKEEGQAKFSFSDDILGNELLLAIVSHELGNALTAINGLTQLLERNLLKQQGAFLDQYVQQQTSAHQLSLVKTILQRTRSMQELIGQLFDMSRVQTGSLGVKPTRQANLAALVRSVVEQYQGISEHIVKIEVSEEAIFASFDAFWIEQVLHNLLSNAIKYSPPNTTVVVGVVRQGEAIAHQEAVTWVRDEGSGISLEHHAALFQRFYRVRSKEYAHVEGSGLGLYISHEIIRQHGGRIWLTSEPGRGSIFSFALPLAQA